MKEQIAQAVDGGLRAAVPISVSASTFMGLTLESWVYVFTIVYTGLQAAYLVYRWRRESRKDKEVGRGKTDDRG